MRVNLRNASRLEWLTRSNPNEAFDVEGYNFVVTTGENYDELKHKANAYDELMQGMKNGSTNAQLIQYSNLLMADPRQVIEIPKFHIAIISKEYLDEMTEIVDIATEDLKTLYNFSHKPKGEN